MRHATPDTGTFSRFFRTLLLTSRRSMDMEELTFFNDVTFGEKRGRHMQKRDAHNRVFYLNITR